MDYDNLDAAIVVWSEKEKNYMFFTKDDVNAYLEPLSAFFVQTNKKANINFCPKGRELSSSFSETMTTSIKSDDRTIINLVLSNDSLQDRTRIVFNEAVTPKYDLGKDVAKFRSLDASVPMLYSLDEDNNELAINEHPFGNGIVKLGGSINVAGHYTLGLKESVGLDLYLVDSKTGITHRLSDGDYEFDAEKGDDLKRFELRSDKDIATSNEYVESELQCRVQGGKLIVSNMKTEGTLSVTDVSGKTIYSDRVVNGEVRISIPQQGIYYVTLISQQGKRQVKAIKY